MLNNSSTAPWVLQFSLLRKITDGFSEKRKVGSGGYGEVYMGKLDNGEEIAVKKFHPQPGLDDKQFMNEFSNLIKVQHENIVRLVGYCYDEQDEYVQHNGKLVLAQREYRMLCFEYLHGGSLDKHLYEEHCGLDWHTRYKIIKGICEGLNYLHGLKESILHLDLKPANILLDKNMVPKIADFGLSRLFGETRTHITENCIGTKRYMPPEFILECKITKKYDVFSLGVIIIEIMTGREGYSKYHETSTSEQFIELVHNKWKVRIEATSIHTSPEEDCKQVKRCIEIALNCVEAERHKRPTIGDIIHKLRETETMHHKVSMSFSQEPESVSSHFKRKEFSPRLETMEEKRGGQGGEEDEEKAVFSKIGPWGGNAGRAHDIKVSSYRLESVTIWCADIVDALAFSYSDLNGKMHTVGPWGGPGGSPRTIKVGPSEFLMEVSGTTGPYILAAADVVRSLMLVTNAGSYGPFGQGGGTAFRTSVQSNDSIVGFFGRAERFVHAIGVYVKPNLPTLSASRHFEREMDQMVRDEKVDSELETIQGERGKEDDDVISEIQLSPRPEPGTDYSSDKDQQIERALQESLNTESPPRQNVPVESVPAKEPPPHVFPSSGVRTCAGCKNPIGHGRFLSCMDSVWHPQCFRCFVCDKPVSEYEFAVHEDQPYHRSCYKEFFHPKCDVCKNFIPTNKDGLIEYRAHPFWMQKYCPSHEDDGTPRCCSCERMEPMDIKYITLDDGRKLCLECLNSAIMDTQECQHLYMDIQEFFEGLNMKLEQQVPLLLVERQALNEAMEAEKSGLHLPENRGLCLSEEQIVRVILRRPIIGPANRFLHMITGPYRLARRCEVTAILILYGLPRLQTGSILAHEVMRAYLRLKGHRSLSPEVEEGICQVLSRMWLKSEIISGSSGNAASTSVSTLSSSSSTPTSLKKGAKTEFEKKLGAFIKHQIETDPSVPYGDGFRAGNRAVERYGLRSSTLDHIRMTGSFPY